MPTDPRPIDAEAEALAQSMEKLVNDPYSFNSIGRAAILAGIEALGTRLAAQAERIARLEAAIVQRRLGPSLRAPGWFEREAELMGAAEIRDAIAAEQRAIGEQGK